MKLPPPEFLYPIESLADACVERVNAGAAILRTSKIAIVGLARNCGEALQRNLVRAIDLCAECQDFAIHVEENDSTDNTKQVLIDACKSQSKVTATMQTLRRKQRGNEFAGPRTIALAQYRTACQEWVRDCAPDADFVVVIDWDQRGGWSQFGVLNGVKWLVDTDEACGMASISLIESETAKTHSGTVFISRDWIHYDAWALRLNTWLDEYRLGKGNWIHQWIPLIGSEPVKVKSAFGGLCIYRTADYLAGTYSGEDCEHVSFHKAVFGRTGRSVFVNPTQRCIMQWYDT